MGFQGLGAGARVHFNTNLLAAGSVGFEVVFVTKTMYERSVERFAIRNNIPCNMAPQGGDAPGKETRRGRDPSAPDEM